MPSARQDRSGSLAANKSKPLNIAEYTPKAPQRGKLECFLVNRHAKAGLFQPGRRWAQKHDITFKALFRYSFQRLEATLYRLFPPKTGEDFAINSWNWLYAKLLGVGFA